MEERQEQPTHDLLFAEALDLLNSNSSSHYYPQVQLAVHKLRLCLAQRQYSLGESHVDTLVAQHALGKALMSLASFSSSSSSGMRDERRANAVEAERLLGKCWRLCKSSLGYTHATTLAVLFSYAMCFARSEQYDEAATLLEECVCLYREHSEFGKRHETTLRTSAEFANCLFRRRRGPPGGGGISSDGGGSVGVVEEALPLLLKCVKTCRREFGDEHSVTLLACGYLRSVRQSLVPPMPEKSSLTSALLSSIFQTPNIEGELNQMADDTRELLRAQYGVGMRLFACNLFSDAIAVLRDCRVRYEHLLGPEAPQTIDCLYLLGMALNATLVGGGDSGARKAARRIGEAEQVNRLCARAASATLGPTHLLTLEAICNLIVSLLKARCLDHVFGLCCELRARMERAKMQRLGIRHVHLVTVFTQALRALHVDVLRKNNEADDDMRDPPDVVRVDENALANMACWMLRCLDMDLMSPSTNPLAKSYADMLDKLAHLSSPSAASTALQRTMVSIDVDDGVAVATPAINFDMIVTSPTMASARFSARNTFHPPPPPAAAAALAPAPPPAQSSEEQAAASATMMTTTTIDKSTPTSAVFALLAHMHGLSSDDVDPVVQHLNSEMLRNVQLMIDNADLVQEIVRPQALLRLLTRLLRQHGFDLKPIKAEEATTMATTSIVDIPAEMRCPITHEIMVDPVCTSNGHTYERTAIEHWFAKCRRDKKPLSDPIQGTPLENDLLAPNHSLRSLISDFRQRNNV